MKKIYENPMLVYISLGKEDMITTSPVDVSNMSIDVPSIGWGDLSGTK